MTYDGYKMVNETSELHNRQSKFTFVARPGSTKKPPVSLAFKHAVTL